jgi:hypothetical protein
MKKYEKRNVSIIEFCKVGTDDERRSRHVEQLTPATRGGSNLTSAYVPTALDTELTRLASVGAKVLGFKQVGNNFQIRMMVPR